ncbi:Cell division control protein 24 [Candida viswanathii]|uniref:Cell division control protein 24 n=1 Tax=Candida viswanathii TaxID=5486 RepID=A0A367YG37_9ASCO|nr:Cell division control protein 24 [Candida viswanathii]
MEHPTPFRTFSTQSALPMNSSSSSIPPSRTVSQSTLNISNFNKQSTPKDHLFYKCEALKRKLQKIPGMEPFLNQAFTQAELYSEQQALALAQERNNANGSMNHHSSLDGAMNRLSVGSDNSSIQSSLTRLATNASSSSSVTNLPTNNNLFTFTAGILPANISVDPATHLWKLFQQGAPLCVIFNYIIPDYQIPVISSDDLRICKKSVYDFLIAVKTHLNFDDDDMFTISNVFSDNTQDLLKIIVVVNKLLADYSKNNSSTDLAANDDVSVDVQITDERSKVFREIIETERKYVQDLELMCKYRQDLIDAENLSSEQIHLLFPNLNEIIDFQRRFLNGLECNINVPIRYQRIGSVFIHASLGPFNAYEPWTIGQLAAIDLINKESANLKKSSTLIDPGFELQSYILKPIQRLCKYPLLLKELIKSSPESTSEDAQISGSSAAFNELLVANTAMKELANQVNEAQRRAENIEHLEKLKERVANWRGFNLDAQGELLFHGTVGVKDSDAEKEYVAYLFEKIIFFFVEIEEKKVEKVEKKSKFSTRKKSSASFSSSTANLLETINTRKNNSLPLELKGRVYISEIYNISAPATPGSTLIISWSGRKENGSFTLRYRGDETRNQWEKCLRDLKTSEMNTQIHKKLRDSDLSLNTNDSSIYDYTGMGTSPTTQQVVPQHYEQRASHGSRHHSSSSTLSMMKGNRVKSGDLSRISASSTTLGSISNNNNSPNTTAPSSSSSDSPRDTPDVAVKLLYKQTELPEPLIVPAQIQFSDLLLKIISKVVTSNLVSLDVKIGRLRYKDDEGDFVNLNSDDDWGLVLDMILHDDSYQEYSDDKRVVTVWVS